VGEFLLDFFLGLDELVIEDVEFEGGDAAETPEGAGQSVDQLGFDIADGLILSQVSFEEGVKFFLGFARQGFELGGEAVFESVLGGAGFAFRRSGSF